MRFQSLPGEGGGEAFFPHAPIDLKVTYLMQIFVLSPNLKSVLLSDASFKSYVEYFEQTIVSEHFQQSSAKFHT